jgi:hypothetical protein
MNRCIAVLLAGCGFTLTTTAAEPEAGTESGPEVATVTPAVEPAAQEQARAYLGLGLVAISHTASTALGDADSSGGGLVLNGALHSRPISPSLDIALRGAIAAMGREYEGGGTETGDVLIEMDGGLRISRIFLLSLGYTTQAVAFEAPEIIFTYNVYPVGIGVLHATDSGYLLGQVRAGGGRLTNDQDDSTEGVGYFGLRGVVQHGFGSSGMQLMLGLGFDRYEVDDLDQTEEFFRMEFGLGFGL